MGMRSRRQQAARSRYSGLPSAAPPKGLTAPSASERAGSGTIRSMSMPMTRPNPRQLSQAPTGLLNENRLGSGEAYATRQKAHSRRRLNAWCPPSGVQTSARPPPKR